MSQSRRLRIFLSYRHRDVDIAEEVAVALRGDGRGDGFEVFFDRDGIRGGAAYDWQIIREIRQCDLFLALFGGGELKGAYMQSELNVARAVRGERALYILPILLPGVGLDALPPFMRRWSPFFPQGNIPADVLHEVQRIERTFKLQMWEDRPTTTPFSSFRFILFLALVVALVAAAPFSSLISVLLLVPILVVAAVAALRVDHGSSHPNDTRVRRGTTCKELLNEAGPLPLQRRFEKRLDGEPVVFHVTGQLIQKGDHDDYIGFTVEVDRRRIGTVQAMTGTAGDRRDLCAFLLLDRLATGVHELALDHLNASSDSDPTCSFRVVSGE